MKPTVAYYYNRETVERPNLKGVSDNFGDCEKLDAQKGRQRRGESNNPLLTKLGGEALQGLFLAEERTSSRYILREVRERRRKNALRMS